MGLMDNITAQLWIARIKGVGGVIALWLISGMFAASLVVLGFLLLRSQPGWHLDYITVLVLDLLLIAAFFGVARFARENGLLSRWLEQFRRQGYITTKEIFKADVNEIRPDYYVYIRSERWFAKRMKKLRQVGWKCERCGEKSYNKGINLNVHHKTYQTLTREGIKDLLVLCDKCHNKEHGK